MTLELSATLAGDLRRPRWCAGSLDTTQDLPFVGQGLETKDILPWSMCSALGVRKAYRIVFTLLESHALQEPLQGRSATMTTLVDWGQHFHHNVQLL